MFHSLSRPSFLVAALALTGAAHAAQAPGTPACARVLVRQTAMVPQEDGTRIVQFRATVQADPSACVVAQYDVVRSYLRPNGTTYEGTIPMRTEVRNGTATVFGQDTANTRGVIYWWAKNITCEPCQAAASGPAPAPEPARPAAPVFDRRGGSSTSGGSGGGTGPAKLIAAGGAGAATLAGLFLLGTGEATSDDEISDTATPTPTTAATVPPRATAAPTASASTPTPTPAPQSGPTVFPGGAPPAASTNGFGAIDLVGSDPGGGAAVRSGRTLTLNFSVNPGQAGTDMRLDVQLYSGGRLCIKDVTGPLPVRHNTTNAVTVPLPSGAWSCPAPFRTTLVRVYFNDRGESKFVEDFPTGWDFVQ